MSLSPPATITVQGLRDININQLNQLTMPRKILVRLQMIISHLNLEIALYPQGALFSVG
jgi:hypothetical protein